MAGEIVTVGPTGGTAVGQGSSLNPLERTILEMVLAEDAPIGPAAVVERMSERRVIGEATVMRAIDALVARGLLVREGEGLRATTTPQAVDQQERATIAPIGGFRPGFSPVCEPWPPRPTKCC